MYNMVSKNLDVLLKKVKLCQTQKCSKLNKRRMKEHKMYMKSQKNMQCPKSAYDRFNCINAFYENSNYKKANDDFTNCSKEKCEKDRAPVDKLFNNFLSKPIPVLSTVSKSRKKRTVNKERNKNTNKGTTR